MCLSVFGGWPTKIADIVFKVLFGFIAQQWEYVAHCRENVNELEEQLPGFETKLEGHINAAKYGFKKANDPEIKRLERKVNDAKDAAKKLVDKYHKANEKNHLRCCGYIPNPFLRHKFGRKATNIKDNIQSLIKKNKEPEGITLSDVPPGMRPPVITEEDFLPESRAEILNRIVEALKDPDIQVIGLWGASGMGKTTLRKRLVERILGEKHFNIRAESENTDDIQEIQNNLGYALTGESFDQAAGAASKKEDLSTRLKKTEKERVLIILDGLSRKIDLINEVGIPLKVKDSGKVCKVVLMSANQNLLLKDMSVRQEHLFRLGVLSDTESIDLFQAIVGEMHDNEPRKKAIAIEIAKESAGFPDLIADRARDLKNQTSLDSWKDARRSIRSEGPERIQTHVNKILGLNSDARELRTLIPLCGHFGDPVISVQDLTIHAKGLGLFDHIDALAATRNHVKKLINILLDYHLVDGDEEHVKIKNLLRKVSMSQEEQRKCTKMSINELNIQDGRFSELKMLLLHAEDDQRDQYKHIPKDFFTNMKELTVLHLTNINFVASPIPSSITHLVKLQTLYLEYCKLANVRKIGKLVTLQHLSFFGSDIIRIPAQLGNLTDLRMLDLRGCHKLQVIEAGVFIRLTNLEEIYLDDRFNNWEVLHRGSNPRGSDNRKASLDELGQMNKLSTLYISFNPSAMLPQELPIENLESYKILLGNILNFPKEENEKLNTLKISLPDSASTRGDFFSRSWMEYVLEKCESLYLEGRIDDIKSVDNLSSEGFSELKHLHVQDSESIACVLEGKSVSAFKFLESLTLANLTNLRKLCHDNLDPGPFRMLKVLKIQHCHKLELLLKLSCIHITPNIEKIEVRECKKMKQIVTDETEDKIDRKGLGWCKLKHLTLRDLPEMTSFITVKRTTRKSSETTRSNTWTTFFNGNQILLPGLVLLELIGLPLLEEIWLHNVPPAELGNLQHLQVEHCDSLKSVITDNQLMMLKNLKSITVKNCLSIQEAFKLESYTSKSSKPSTPPQHKSCSQKLIPGCLGHRNVKEEQETVIGNPEIDDVLKSLHELKLIELQSLKRLWNSNPRRILRFRDLSHLTVHGCHELEHLFSASMAKGLPEMSHLCIENCKKLKVIIVPDKADEELVTQGQEAMTSNSLILKLTSLSLENLENLATFSHGIVSLNFPSLKRLKISNCPLLAGIYNASQQQLTAAFSDTDQFGEASEVDHGNALHAGNSDFQAASLFHQMVTESFSQLEDLVISEMDFRNIWQGDVSEESFPKLSELTVKACERLSHIFPQDMLKSFCNIKRLSISNCKSLEHILTVDGERTRSSVAPENGAELREIYLEGLEKLEHIWPTVDPDEGIIPFKMLRVFSVRECKTVKYLFPVSLNKELPKLERIEANMCDGLEHIFLDDARTEIDDVLEIKFKNLQFLKLWKLKSLNNLYSEPHISRWPSLTQLMVVECGNVETFCSTDDFSSSEHCLFWVDKDEIPFRNLEILEVDQNQLMGNIWQGELPEKGLFCNLRVFKLVSPKGEPVVLPQGFLPHAADLEELEVSNCQFSIYGSQYDQSAGVSLSKLYGMSFSRSTIASPTVQKEKENQQNLAERPQWLTVVLQKLWHAMLPEVRVFSDGFLGIKGKSFQHLMGLEVAECHHLKFFLTIEMAKGLPHLTRLTVRKCKLMEVIMGNEKDNAQENFTYKFLKCLTLDSLPEIKSFSAESTKYHFCSLEEVIVRQCPKMRTFTRLGPNIPILYKAEIEGEKKMLAQYERRLNIVISSSYAEMAAFPGMERVKLSEFPKWLEQWGNIQVKTSCRVRQMKISNCHSLLVAVPSKLIDLLGQLIVLRVENCDRMKEIFDLSHGGGQNEEMLLPKLRKIHLQKLDELNHIWRPGHSLYNFSFGNLNFLEVGNCNRLRSIFTKQIVAKLTSLKDMTIADCTDLEYIISSDDGGRLTERTIVFPKLETLVLVDLPYLKSFHIDYLHLDFPSLKEKPKVFKCPKVKGIDKMYTTSDEGYDDDGPDHFPASPSEIYSLMTFYVIICLLFFSFWINGPAFVQGTTTSPF